VQIIDLPKSRSQGWQTPGWETPGWETPGWETPGWETPGWETPGWETPGWETPGWETPGWETPSLSDSDQQIKDIRRQIRNNSNTYSAVNLRALVNGAVPPDVKFQGVAYRLYTTAPVDPCEQKLVGNTQVLLNIQNLDVSASNFFSPADSSSAQNGTVWLAPHESIYFNIRAVGPVVSVAQVQPERVVVKAAPQAVGTQDAINHVITPPAAFSQLSLIAGSLPVGQAGQPYSATIPVVGGTPPYHFTSSELPGGLVLNPLTGAIAGTTTTAGMFSITVHIDDSGSPVQSASQNYVIQITPGPAAQLVFVAQPSTTATGQPITPAVQVGVTDAFGNFVTPTGTQVSMAFGNHPEGATFDGTTVVTMVNGIASFGNLSTTTAGTGFTLVASSGILASATSYSFNVIGPLTIATLALPNGTQGSPYAQHTFASGGVPPYVWSIDVIPDGPQFNLPDGLSLTTENDGTGLISGTPTTVLLNGASFRLRVTDTAGHTTTQDTCIHVDESTSGPIVAAGIGEPGGPFSAAEVADTLVGEGVAISNVVYTGVAQAIGTFHGGFPTTGLSGGIVLSSGAVSNLNPPNDSDGKTAMNNGSGDADLDALIPGFTTRDAAVLEFDFRLTDPDTSVVKFDYVFASEEYNEYVHSRFNDVFGFFISGPGLAKTNFALIPGTSTPVSINNVNGGNPFGSSAQHPELFINNDPSDDGGSIAIQADGLITVLTLQATVVPGETYHMKIAIADAGDFALDSWVLLKAHSLSAVCPTIPR
jgi:putative Ig domain-containing protein